MCHLTERDTFKLEPIIEVSLVPFLLDTTIRAGCLCVFVCVFVARLLHMEYQNPHSNSREMFAKWCILQRTV